MEAGRKSGIFLWKSQILVYIIRIIGNKDLEKKVSTSLLVNHNCHARHRAGISISNMIVSD